MTWRLLASFVCAGVLLGGALVMMSLRAYGLERQLARAQGQIQELQKSRLDAGAIAELSGQACRAAVNFRVRSQREASTIREAPKDPGSAAAAYRRILCQRPEAAGLAACSGGQ